MMQHHKCLSCEDTPTEIIAALWLELHVCELMWLYFQTKRKWKGKYKAICSHSLQSTDFKWSVLVFAENMWPKDAWHEHSRVFINSRCCFLRRLCLIVNFSRPPTVSSSTVKHAAKLLIHHKKKKRSQFSKTKTIHLLNYCTMKTMQWWKTEIISIMEHNHNKLWIRLKTYLFTAFFLFLFSLVLS